MDSDIYTFGGSEGLGSFLANPPSRTLINSSQSQQSHPYNCIEYHLLLLLFTALEQSLCSYPRHWPVASLSSTSPTRRQIMRDAKLAAKATPPLQGQSRHCPPPTPTLPALSPTFTLSSSSSVALFRPGGRGALAFVPTDSLRERSASDRLWLLTFRSNSRTRRRNASFSRFTASNSARA